MKKIFQLYTPVRRLINKSGSAAIANMVLGGIGGFKFKIADLYELKIVLINWRFMGLRSIPIRTVFKVVLEKKIVQEKIKKKNLFLLARLKEIFPMFKSEIIPPGFNLDKALYDHYKNRFEGVITYYQKKSMSLDAMIREENGRKLPVGVNRNNLLAFLIKKRHNFQCQVCALIKNSIQQNLYVEAHHLIQLSQGGLDCSENIIILCKKHHSEAHSGLLEIIHLKKLQIVYKGRKYFIMPN